MDARASLMLLQVQVPNFLSPGGTIPRRPGNIPDPTPNTTQPMPGCDHVQHVAFYAHL
jgi:hypothetical protein